MRDTSKSIRQVKKRDMYSSLIYSSIFDNLIEDNVVFNASVDAWKKSLLDFRINVTICEKIFGDTVGENEMICFSDCAGQ